MKSLSVERLAIFFFGFLPGLLLGGLAVIVYVKVNGGIVQVGPNSLVFQNWVDGYEAPPPNYWWTADSYGDTAIHVPLNRIALVRSKDTLGAIQFVSFDVVNDVAIGHSWRLKRNDEDGILAVEDERGFAVWEVSNVVGLKVEGGVEKADIRYTGGELYIQVGDLSVEWSQSTWLYFQPGVSFALLDVEDIRDVTADLLNSIRVANPKH